MQELSELVNAGLKDGTLSFKQANKLIVEQGDVSRRTAHKSTVLSRVSAHGRLEVTGQESGVGAYRKKPTVLYNTYTKESSIIGVGTYTEMGAYSGHNGTCRTMSVS